MKYINIGLLILVVFFVSGCVGTRHIQGTYSYGYGKLVFTEQPNKFEYFGGGGERGEEHYSEGYWMLINKKLLLSGFNDSTLKLLNVSSNIVGGDNSSIGKIVIECRIKNTFAKVDMIIDDNLVIKILGDTSLTLDTSIRRIQLRSYLSHPGLLLSSPSTIDTLYSKKIDIEDAKMNHPIVNLKFTISEYDFNRENLTDTLTVRNGRTLQWKKVRLRKL